MSGTPETSPTDAPNAPKEKPVTPRIRKPAVTQAELDALIAGAVAKRLAEVVPGIVEAVVARLTPPPVAPIAPVAPSSPPIPAGVPDGDDVAASVTSLQGLNTAPVTDVVPASVTTTVTTTTTTSENQTWKCQAAVGRLQDRTTKNGAPELVVWVKPAGTRYYPVAYKAVRDAILGDNLRVGDTVALDGFVSTNVGTDGKTYTKLVIRTCRVLRRTAAPAPIGPDRVLNLDADDAVLPEARDQAVVQAVASAQPASAPQQALLGQLPSGPAEALAPLPDAAPPVETAEIPF